MKTQLVSNRYFGYIDFKNSNKRNQMLIDRLQNRIDRVENTHAVGVGGCPGTVHFRLWAQVGAGTISKNVEPGHKIKVVLNAFIFLHNLNL